ncbi:MAG: Hsp20/alpha crystallin family protein [Halobacteriota archaeon]
MDDNTHEGDGNTQEEEPKEQRTLPDACRTLKDVRSSAEDLVNRIRWPLWWPWAPIEPFTAEPEADIVDKDGEFRVMIDLPGLAKQDIEIYATRDSIELAASLTTMRTFT